MRFASLGSGSRGNGTLVEIGATCILLDCGFSVSQIRRRLARLGKTPEDLDAILVTHEHTDHIGGVAALARTYGLGVYATAGTARYFDGEPLPRLSLFDSHVPFMIGDAAIEPFPVPHDAAEPSQFVFGDGARRLGILTDVGTTTPHIEASLSGCDALMVECNYDEAMLQMGDYPYPLKQRVAGRHGHLSNRQTVGLLERLDCTKLQHVVAAHLSEKNNTPALARNALAAVLGCEEEWIAVADQGEGLAWRTF